MAKRKEFSNSTDGARQSRNETSAKELMAALKRLHAIEGTLINRLAKIEFSGNMEIRKPGAG